MMTHEFRAMHNLVDPVRELIKDTSVLQQRNLLSQADVHVVISRLKNFKSEIR